MLLLPLLLGSLGKDIVLVTLSMLLYMSVSLCAFVCQFVSRWFPPRVSCSTSVLYLSLCFLVLLFVCLFVFYSFSAFAVRSAIKMLSGSTCLFFLFFFFFSFFSFFFFLLTFIDNCRAALAPVPIYLWLLQTTSNLTYTLIFASAIAAAFVLSYSDTLFRLMLAGWLAGWFGGWLDS